MSIRHVKREGSCTELRNKLRRQHYYVNSPISTNTTIHHIQSAVPPKQVIPTASEAPKAELQKTKGDVVTISNQAILMNSKTYSPAEELQESVSDKAYEKKLGQR